jgi:thioredoxin reductase
VTARDVVIVGAGPAGVAAAIQLKRCGLPAALYERDAVGGLVRNAHRLENYPGFPEGISGERFARLLAEQLARHDVEVCREEVAAAAFDGEAFRLECAGAPASCRVLIVASGTKPKEFTSASLPPAAGRIFYEVYPIVDVSDKTVVIVGAGDAAFDYALTLGRRNDVTVLGRSGECRCIPALRDSVAAAPRINYIPRAEVVAVDVDGDGSVAVTYAGPAGRETLASDYLLFALGREPELGFIGTTITDRAAALEREGRLYFVGDVRNGDLRQAALAAGDGVRAALQIYRRRWEETR